MRSCQYLDIILRIYIWSAERRSVSVVLLMGDSVLDREAERNVIVAAFASGRFAHERVVPAEHAIVSRHTVDQMLTRYVHLLALQDGVGSVESRLYRVSPARANKAKKAFFS